VSSPRRKRREEKGKNPGRGRLFHLWPGCGDRLVRGKGGGGGGKKEEAGRNFLQRAALLEFLRGMGKKGKKEVARLCSRSNAPVEIELKGIVTDPTPEKTALAGPALFSIRLPDALASGPARGGRGGKRGKSGHRYAAPPPRTRRNQAGAGRGLAAVGGKKEEERGEESRVPLLFLPRVGGRASDPASPGGRKKGNLAFPPSGLRPP